MSTNRQGGALNNDFSPRCPTCHGKGTLAHYVCMGAGCRQWYTRDVYEQHVAFRTPLPECGHPAVKRPEGARPGCPTCQGRGRVAPAADAAGHDAAGA